MLDGLSFLHRHGVLTGFSDSYRYIVLKKRTQSVEIKDNLAV